MPPLVALLLYSSLVFCLLRYDRRQSKEVSGAMWVPTIWMFSIATKSLVIWFGARIEDVESGSPLDRLFVTGLLCLGLVILARRNLDWRWIINKNSWLIMLLTYTLISIFWSDIPFISLKRWFRELTGVIMALVVLTDPAPRQAMESLLRKTAYILIPFSILLIKYFPQYGLQYNRWTGEVMWVGVTLQKNGLGRLCLVSAFFLVWTLTRRWKAREISTHKFQTLAEVVLLALTLWLLKGPSDYAGSASGFAALTIGLAAFACLLWLKKQRLYFHPNLLIAITGIIVAAGIITPFSHGSSVAGFTSLVGRDATLTGRTDIWAGLVPIAEQHPLLGSGFGGFWTSGTEAEVMFNEAHNGYLEVLLQLGFVGLLITSMFLLSLGRSAARALAYDYDWASLCICFLLMAAVHNISESSFDSFTRHLMAMVLFLAVTLPAVTRSAHTRRSLTRQTAGIKRSLNCRSTRAKFCPNP
jgi:exopolysaccharide production protein ExoQ